MWLYDELRTSLIHKNCDRQLILRRGRKARLSELSRLSEHFIVSKSLNNKREWNTLITWNQFPTSDKIWKEDTRWKVVQTMPIILWLNFKPNIVQLHYTILCHLSTGRVLAIPIWPEKICSRPKRVTNHSIHDGVIWGMEEPLPCLRGLISCLRVIWGLFRQVPNSCEDSFSLSCFIHSASIPWKARYTVPYRRPIQYQHVLWTKTLKFPSNRVQVWN